MRTGRGRCLGAMGQRRREILVLVAGIGTCHVPDVPPLSLLVVSPQETSPPPKLTLNPQPYELQKACQVFFVALESQEPGLWGS